MQLTKQTQIQILEKYQIDNKTLQDEIEQFILYWKEKSPNGKKELWQMQKTFDPNLRLHRWLRNYRKRNKPEETKPNLKDMTYEQKLQRMKDLGID